MKCPMIQKNSDMLFKSFLDEHGDSFATPEEAIQYFINDYNNSLHTNEPLSYIEDDPYMQSMELFEKALSTESDSKVSQLLDQALELWPNNWHAHMYRLVEPDSTDLIEIIEKYEHLERKAYKTTWKKKGKMDTSPEIEIQAYLNIKQHFSELLFEFGLLDKAQKHFEKLYRMDDNDSMGARYRLLAIYVRKYDWKNAWKLYLKVPEAESDDQMILPIIVLAVLTDRLELAKKLFKKLVELNSDIHYLFEDEDGWPFSDIIEADEVLAQKFAPYSYDSLLLSLQAILPILYDNVYLYKTLEKEYRSLNVNLDYNAGRKSLFIKETYSYEENNAHSHLVADMGVKLQSLYSKDESNPLRNIGVERARILANRNLRTYEDFSKKTEKQIKAIDGIGPVTIKRLKENGVQFKSDSLTHI